ncbi:hypothetical protein V2J09_020131 [Rumex salicifolius]
MEYLIVRESSKKKESKKEGGLTNFDQNATMAVVENAPIDSGIGVRSSSPPPFDISGAGDSDRATTEVQDSSDQDARHHLRLQHHQLSGGFGSRENGVKKLEEMFSKLNPMAEEFVPPYLTNPSSGFENGLFVNGFGLNQMMGLGNGGVNLSGGRRKKGGYNQVKRRNNNRSTMVQREEVIRRTVFVSDIDQQVTEEQLAALFINCGQVVDCRICGDPNSVLRFAFVEFTDEEGAHAALTLSGTMLGFYAVKVLPSKTAIVPVNSHLLPQTEDERDMCARTIYCTNIDKRVSQTEVRLFFESVCGQVHRLRLLGDYNHSTRIAFVEFVMAESAIAALNCSGVVLGSLPIRVSPSKTPVRPRLPRGPVQ